MLGSIVGVLFDGLAYGMLLFLLSVGLSVTLGMMNFVNLAHCSFAMVGGYAAVWLTGRAGWPFLAALPAAFLAGAAVFDAYAWPQTLTDDQLLEKLVALNHQRAAEESRGLIKYLRPDFQEK